MSLEELEEQVERIYIDMENELLLNIAKKLSAGKPMEIDKWDETNQQPLVGSGEVNEWQLQRLKELNGLNEENAKIIANYSGKTVEEIEQIFARAKEIGMTRDEATISEGVKLGILNEINPDTEELVVSSILSSATKEVLTTFNKQNNSLLASAGSEYTDIVNKVSSQVLAGTKTTNKAMQEAVSQLAERGLTGFTARNGARWNPEGYTKMVIRSNTQNTINRIQDERIRTCGGDYIEVSSHIGARPLCSQDQGQVFSLSGNTSPIEDLDGNRIKVRAWSSSSYGEPAGIFGINCGHSRYMFVPGLSKKREMDFTKKENDEAYIEKQRQRQYERTIRNKKREIAMLKQTGAEPSYIRRKQNSLSDTRKEYLEFLDKTGRTRITVNEWIGTTSITNDEMMVTKNIKIGKSDTYIKSIKIKDLPKKDRNNITKIISNSNSKIKNLMKHYENDIKIRNYKNDSRSYYSSILNSITFNLRKDSTKGYKTFFHEVTHMIDHKIKNPSQSKAFIDSIYKDFDNFKNMMMNKYNLSESEFYVKMSKKMKTDDTYNSLSDIIGAITNNKCLGNAYHRKEYWKDSGKIGREFFAHNGSALIRNSNEELYNFKTIFPNAYKYFENSLKR